MCICYPFAISDYIVVNAITSASLNNSLYKLTILIPLFMGVALPKLLPIFTTPKVAAGKIVNEVV